MKINKKLLSSIAVVGVLSSSFGGVTSVFAEDVKPVTKEVKRAKPMTETHKKAKPMTTVQNNTATEDYFIVGATVQEQGLEQETKEKLGVPNDAEVKTLTVTGDMLNKYLNEGEPLYTTAFSSSYVKYHKDGEAEGVTVKIMTPENITEVTEETYQNAAITAGIKNATIYVGSAVPVDGSGALGGIYAMQEQKGELNMESVDLSQDEIDIIKLLIDAGVDSTVANAAVAVYKSDVAKRVQAGEVVDNSYVTGVITRANSEFNVTIDNHTYGLVQDYLIKFSKSDAANDIDILRQLGTYSDTIYGTEDEQPENLFEGVDNKLASESSNTGFFGAIKNFFVGIGNFFSNLF